jgi:hypothetical protein
MTEIGNNVSPLPDHTLDGTSYSERTSITNVNDYGKQGTYFEPEASNALSQSTPEFLEKALSGKVYFHPFYVKLFLISASVILMGWTFIQDNGAGKLNDFDGYKWLSLKIIIIVGFMWLVWFVFDKALKEKK